MISVEITNELSVLIGSVLHFSHHFKVAFFPTGDRIVGVLLLVFKPFVGATVRPSFERTPVFFASLVRVFLIARESEYS